jgi:hypothetical protein
MAGNLVARAGGPRIVDPNNPLVGPMGTRASTHMVARASLTEEQRLQQTIFGLVPGSIPLNQKIGEAPQIYMNDRLPNVPGLTSVGGASTGVVAGEAARWHSMTATLAMQSKGEIEALKKQMVATGVLSKEFMGQFDDMLPIISKITDNAARESALIVAELRAGKITVEAAKSKIIALNLEVEKMIATAAGAQAATLGRTLNPTMVPTLNQPVVDATGRSNMRELFKKSKTKDFIDKVARSLGVRTSGAGYNIETTRPRKMNMGGYVYTMNDGSIVPGPNINADVVPAMLTPGEFVVNAEATQANLPLLMAINGGAGTSGAGMITGGQAKSLINLPGEFLRRINLISGARRSDTRSGRQVFSPGATNYDQMGSRARRNAAWNDPILALGRPGNDEVVGHIYSNQFYRQYGGPGGSGSSPRATGLQFEKLTGLSLPASRSGYSGTYDILPNQFMTIPKAFNTKLNRGGATPADWLASPRRPEHLLSLMQLLTSQGITPLKAAGIAQKVLGRINANISKMPPTAVINERMFGNIVTNSTRQEMMRLKSIGELNERQNAARPALPRGSYTPAAYRGYNRRNSGGMIRMNAGGMVPGYQRGGIIAEAREKGFFGQGMIRRNPGAAMSPMASMGMGMGMQMAGSMIPGPAGTALQIASFLPMIMPGTFGKTLAIIPKIISGFTNVSKLLGAIRSGLVLITRAIPGMAVIAGIYGIVKAFQAWRKEVAETKRENIMLAGITKKGAEEAKIKYVDLSESIKLANEQLKLNKDRGLAAYAAYTSAGIPGLTLTIKQLKELKKQVKETMPETLATFNSIDASKLKDFATNLKAQYVAGGMSIQDATNKIYALTEASNKAGMGLQVLSDKGFTSIKDKSTAALSILTTFKNTLKDISNTDSEAFAANLDSVMGSLDSAVNSLVGTKNASGETITQAQAVAMQYEKIVNLGLKNVTIGKQGLSNLQKHRPELAAIISSSDTVFGIYSKWKLALAGVQVDLKNITSEQAIGIAMYQDALNLAASSAQTNTTGALGKSAAAVNKLKTEIATAEKTSKSYASGESASSKARLKAINDEIKAIRKRADEKKKALQDSLNAENTELEIQKLQLEYQQALSRGDKDAAAQAQIQIQQVTKQYQTQKAMDRIEENARKEEEKLQKQADAIQAKEDKKAAAASTAGNTVSQKSETLNKILEIQSRISKLAVEQANVDIMPAGKAKTESQQVVTGLRKTLMDELTKLPNAVQEAFTEYVDPNTDKIKKDIVLKRSGMAIGGAEGAFNKLTKEVTSAGAINYDKMKETLGGGMTLKNVVEAIQGKPISGAATKISVTSAPVYAGRGGTVPRASSSVSAMDLVNSNISLETGTTFTDKNGVKWKITGPANPTTRSVPVSKARYGGYATAGKSVIVGDAGMPELFVPKTDGMIIPDLSKISDLGPKFNIPRGSSFGSMGGSSNSYNNNSYTINIELNGTNVTADDIMKRMKSEMALINAKEGRSRTIGGQY